MYVRYAERHRFKPELLSLNETGIGGIKEAIVQVHGDGAYSRLKFEGGVHRVQRIPATESSGRIHTSTATVVVLPEVDEVEIEIDEERDLRIDVKRSSGPGGQSVNTTDSAVRITHLPTGLVVEIQDEKSQHKNKAKAISVLRSRLYDLQQQKQRAADSAARRSMVGAGDRSDKIRTYNFPQDRVTDHRIGKTVHNLPSVMDGDLDDLIDALDDGRPGRAARGRRRRRLTCRIGRRPDASRRPATLLREGADSLARGRLRDGRGSTPSCCSATRSGPVGPLSSPIPRRRSGPTRRARYRADLDRRAAGEPVAYIRGIKEFYGLAFERRRPRADPAARDRAPRRARPRTRSMRRLASSRDRPGAPPIRVVDVGTGSGAIAVALAVSLRRRRRARRGRAPGRPTSRPTPSDLARENAVGHAVADRIAFAEADLLPAGRRAARSTSSSPTCRTSARRDGRPAGRDLVRAGARARRRRRRARGHRAAARPAARDAGRSTASRCSRSAPTRARRSSALVAAKLPGWACAVEPDLAGLPRVARIAAARRARRPERLEPAVGHHQGVPIDQDARPDPAHPPDRPRHRRDARRRRPGRSARTRGRRSARRVARGVLVSLVTGRMVSSAMRFARELELTAPVVGYQGALDPRDAGRRVRSGSVACSSTRRCRPRRPRRSWPGRATDGLDPHLNHLERFIVRHGRPATPTTTARSWARDPSSSGDLVDVDPPSDHQGPRGRRAAAAERARAAGPRAVRGSWPTSRSATRGSSSSSAPGVSKGRAVRWLARRLGPARGGAGDRRPVERPRDARRGRPRGGDADRAGRGAGGRPATSRRRWPRRAWRG